jgi:hypothetical protein
MYRQKKIINGVKAFSPALDSWKAKSVASRPKKVKVSFNNGQTGLLDMESPRAVHWAEMIDARSRENQPVYIEVDEDSNVITKLLIPSTFKVERITTDQFGNLNVLFQPSSAVHLLLKTEPEFEAMRTKLQDSLNNGTKLVVTETRDEHEIIDIRLPDFFIEGKADLSPSPPPDPPVSEARALELFNNMNGETCSPCSPGPTCIPFLYPDDGCWIRAHIMCHLMRTGGPNTTTNPPEDPEKVWIQGSLNAPTANHPDCRVIWYWHVAPTLTVTLPGGNEKRVIDPSLSSSPISESDWKGLQGDPSAVLTDTSWTDYNWIGDTQVVDLAQCHLRMQDYRDSLKDRCLDIGPPPYSCIRGMHFIIDRNTFSDDEIEAMLTISNPATIVDAFYIVVDGYSPNSLGFTSATMSVTPALTISPTVSGMNIVATRVVFEDQTHLNRRQRITWVYNIGFSNISGFTVEQRIITLNASISSVNAEGYLYLIRQPNPYEIDGEVAYLSTDLRVFPIKQGDSKFGVSMGTDPNSFITQVLNNMNTGSTGGQTFDSNISTDQQTSRLELSQMAGGVRVYNFAIAKVRYRALTTSATNVRVFFRLFPAATTSLEYNQSTTYRRYATGSNAIPLLGIKNGETVAIPCFASSRVNSASASLTTQTDTPNVQTLPPNASGAEVVRYFGCWLDINQTQPQFPITPSPVNGPFPSGRLSIQELIRNEHQCLVSEIAFDPSPAQNGSTPSSSDKLAQRNLAIVESANPGFLHSRRIPQTFEILPTPTKLEHDELMIDWGNIPVGSVATLFIPGMNADDTLTLAAQKYRTHRFVRLDANTIKMNTGGFTYLPLPYTDQPLACMLTIDLPEGVEKGQVFKVVVKQVSGSNESKPLTHVEKPKYGLKYIVGAFQLTIPVKVKADMLQGQQRLLSNLKWIQGAIPVKNRWFSVFNRYVVQIANRVDALGGNSEHVAPSPSGNWQAAYRKCLLFFLLIILLTSLVVISSGTQSILNNIFTDIPAATLLILVLLYWRRVCRPKICKIIKALLFGVIIGFIVLLILIVLGASESQMIKALAVSGIVALILAIIAWKYKCFVKG